MIIKQNKNLNKTHVVKTIGLKKNQSSYFANFLNSFNSKRDENLLINEVVYKNKESRKLSDASSVLGLQIMTILIVD